MSAFWASVQRHDGRYAAFPVRVAVIAVMWATHHGIFRYLKRADGRLRAINTVWLLALILNPFATKLLTSTRPETPATQSWHSGFYAVRRSVAGSSSAGA